MARGILHVLSYIDPAQADEFNKWYDEEHLPAVCDHVEGFVSARRFEPVDGAGGTFLAIYEIDADSIEEAHERLLGVMKSGAFKMADGVKASKAPVIELFRQIADHP